ncbi:HET-domain-containing protein [Xylaria sp. FL1042]|nr:HET-domain-containing protein [Xylaria sp. FL1042]
MRGYMFIMTLCGICHDLQVDSTTNLTTEETSRPESHRLRTFSISEALQDWRQSAEGGCATCHLIWQALCRFDKDSTLDILLQTSPPSSPYHSDDDDRVYLELSGFVGHTLLLEFVGLPPETHFPTLELFSRDATSSCFQIIGAASEVASDLDLSLCIRLTSKWLRDCELKHPQCTAQKSSTLPTRVLDVGDSLAAVSIRLLETEPGQSDKYVALSYCWGKTGNITTTKSTLKERKKDIAWNILPKSFRDAIEVVRSLGIRYLWIDALCIIQDDVDDWESESAKMADVYENAFLTISTDAALDPTQGIFTTRQSDMVSTADTLGTGRARPARNVAIEQFPVTDKTGKTCIVYAREPLNHSDIISPRSYYDVTYPLMSRAWTLQERLLSGRILHVTAAELIWECKTTLCCECGTISRESDYMAGNPSPKIAYDIAMQSIIEEGRNNLLNLGSQASKQHEGPQTPKTSREWILLIGGYSNRMLTYDTDKLPAISALARRFSLTDELPTPRTYLAGLWLEDFPWMLCWRVFQRRFEKRPGSYCAPTWSWASLSTPVIWDMQVFEARARVEVLGAGAAPVVQANVFGRVKGAYAVLRGPVQRAVLEVDVLHHAVLALRNTRGERIFFVPDLNPPENNNTGDVSPEPQSEADIPPESDSPLLQASLRRVTTHSTLRDGGEVVCLWLLQGDTEDKVYALVLVPAPHDAIARCAHLTQSTVIGSLFNAAATFERVGLITAMSRVYQRNDVATSQWFAGTEVETVCIV